MVRPPPPPSSDIALRIITLPRPPGAAPPRPAGPVVAEAAPTVSPAAPPAAGRLEEAPAVGAGVAAAAPAIRPTVADRRRGQQLLDRIASGDGPAIVIGWPGEPAARRRLVRHLERCAGWRRLLLADGRLWRLADPAGRPWQPAAAARPSGLLRDLDGAAADDAVAAALRARHNLAGGRPVAAVARHWDARLLGGLARLVGPGWGGRGPGGGDLMARYALDGGRLSVIDIQVAGRPLPGRVDLGPLSRCGR